MSGEQYRIIILSVGSLIGEVHELQYGGALGVVTELALSSCRYGYRTNNKKPLVSYRFLNLSSFLDLSPGVFIEAISSRC